jgi:hypothetical protein
VEELQDENALLRRAQKLIVGKQRLLPRSHAGKDGPGLLVTGIGWMANGAFMLATPRLARLIEAATMDVIEPAMIDAPEPAILHAPVA